MEVITETREMSITHAEFFRLLPRIIPGAAVQRRKDGARIETADGVVEMTLGSEGCRKIASLALPVTRVTLKFRGFDRDGRAGFRRRFAITFQKGGG